MVDISFICYPVMRRSLTCSTLSLSLFVYHLEGEKDNSAFLGSSMFNLESSRFRKILNELANSESKRRLCCCLKWHCLAFFSDSFKRMENYNQLQSSTSSINNFYGLGTSAKTFNNYPDLSPLYFTLFIRASLGYFTFPKISRNFFTFNVFGKYHKYGL